MVADDAVFKADGVIYTKDTKGEQCVCAHDLQGMGREGTGGSLADQAQHMAGRCAHCQSHSV